jgi:hypothetical protein
MWMFSSTTNSKSSSRIICGLLIVATAVLSGCCSVRQEPFTKFDEATTNTLNAVASAASACNNFTQNDFSKTFLSNNNKLEHLVLKLKVKDGTYSLTMPDASKLSPKEPDISRIYVNQPNALLKVKKLNFFFSRYALLLKSMADPTLISDANFNLLKTQVGTTGKDAWMSLYPDTKTEKVDAVNSLLADLTANIWKNSLKNKQRKILLKILTDYKELTNAFAKHGSGYLTALISITESSYAIKTKNLIGEWGGKRDKSDILKDMLKINRQYTAVVAILNVLLQSYRELPAAYNDLIASLQDKAHPQKELNDFYYHSLELQFDLEKLKNNFQ